MVFRDKHIIGLFVISLVAFLSFGFLFTKFEMNVGAEALAAAFGTLFMILSTKFLMEKESESKIQSRENCKVDSRLLGFSAIFSQQKSQNPIHCFKTSSPS